MTSMESYAREFSKLVLEAATNERRRCGFRCDLARLSESNAEREFLKATSDQRDTAKLKLSIARCDLRGAEVELRLAGLELERLEARQVKG